MKDLYSTTPPTEPGHYWWWNGFCGDSRILHVYNSPYIEGLAIQGQGGADRAVWKLGGEWGPRIPSAEQLATMGAEIESLRCAASILTPEARQEAEVEHQKQLVEQAYLAGHLALPGTISDDIMKAVVGDLLGYVRGLF